MSTIGLSEGFATIRISESVLAESGLSLYQELDVQALPGKIVLIPCDPARLSLQTMVAGIPADAVLDEEFFGEPIGKEVW
jgi:hypothetical protein